MRLHIVLALLAVDHPHFAAFYLSIKLVFPDSSVLAGAPPVTYIPVTRHRRPSDVNSSRGQHFSTLVWEPWATAETEFRISRIFLALVIAGNGQWPATSGKIILGRSMRHEFRGFFSIGKNMAVGMAKRHSAVGADSL
jgi:hypothetical protein